MQAESRFVITAERDILVQYTGDAYLCGIEVGGNSVMQYGVWFIVKSSSFKTLKTSRFWLREV